MFVFKAAVVGAGTMGGQIAQTIAASGTPVVLKDVKDELVQAEIETFAIRGDGEVAWRVAHSDVVTEAELVGGRLVLTSFSGEVQALDPATGQPAR